ncbi:hypothetical protein CPB83DRAFT_854004 [Crepidotus variabilis]|uniref:Mitochondrial ribosomal protein L41 n=1 Tax=Crepidotus variabilis TaxID=179855 RepID=A0A9P6EGH1_9AGAR|nr:hypothetical protein CPB83DRAFT_854004 [Crepidotus variabilis]
MIPTAVRCSKASRAALTPKRAGKDFYKGTRQAFLPGGPRTGAPGRHVVRGKAKYRLMDDKVRVYVAPTLEDIVSTPLKPYVAIGKKLTLDQEIQLFGKFRGPKGITPEHFLRVAREHTYASANPDTPYRNPEPPSWMSAQKRLGIFASNATGLSVPGSNPVATSGGASKRNVTSPKPKVRELEVVEKS